MPVKSAELLLTRPKIPLKNAELLLTWAKNPLKSAELLLTRANVQKLRGKIIANALALGGFRGPGAGDCGGVGRTMAGICSVFWGACQSLGE